MILLDKYFDSPEVQAAILQETDVVWFDPAKECFSGDPELCVNSFLSIYGLRKIRQKYPHLNHIIHAGCKVNSFDCSSYYPKYYSYLYNKEAVWMPLGMLHTLQFNKGPLFVRPDSGMKPFTGDVFWSASELTEQFGGKNDDLMVLVAKASHLTEDNHAEFRCHISNKEIVAVAQYAGKECQFPTQYVQDIIAAVEPPDNMYVMDIIIHQNMPFVLELNSWSCSGIYDTTAIPVIVEAAIRDKNGV